MEPVEQTKIFRRFTLALSIVAICIAVIPFVVGLIGTSPGSTYLGSQYNTDDHMVYAGWMQQAMEGRFFFENRFTTDPQPGLGIHIYFLALGWVAKIVGVIFAATLGRLLFTFLSVHALGRLLERVNIDIYTRKLALTLSVFGGGIGFLIWHQFGRVIVRAAPPWLHDALLGFQTVDIWQPEVMFFSSMLTNGLFMVSLFLMLTTIISVLDCRTNKKAVIYGAISIGLLMNIHSYDVLLLGLVLLAFLISNIGSPNLTKGWVARTALIVAGVLPAALWFVYVLKVDPVFQARAETLTYSSNFRTILGAIFPSWILGLIGLFVWPARSKPFAIAGASILLILPIGMAIGSSSHIGFEYFLTPIGFYALLTAIYLANYLLATEDTARNLIFSWASVAILAPYFPGLFQRKLGMMMLVPWAIMAAFGIAEILKKQERSVRNLVTTLCVLCLSATSVQWLFRELAYIKNNVSVTTTHPVYLSPDINDIIKTLQGVRRDAIIIAPPGIPSPAYEEASQHQIPDQFLTPLIPDLNPVMVGLTGARAYAGHWSETPHYPEKLKELQALYFGKATPEQRKDLLKKMGATYFIALKPGSISGMNIPDLSSLGTPITDGAKFQLFKVNP